MQTSMSELASAFKMALERCQKDARELSANPINGRLLDASRNGARALLDIGYEVIARLRKTRNIPLQDVNYLELSIKQYYGECASDTVTARSLQLMRSEIDEAIKVFLSLKPYLAEGAVKENRSALASRKIFIVHGKDEQNKDALKDMLARWDFTPIILAEQANRGRVLIEKLLDHTSDVGFVFVLMTPDDVGTAMSSYSGLLDEIASSLLHPPKTPVAELGERICEIFKPRVRQNVLFEYGLCIGSLGRERVCMLLGGELEIPSDVLGYGYTRFKENVSECEEAIKRELKAAGYELPQ